MWGHLECFEDECFWIADDPWFPWPDISRCRDGDTFRLLNGENAGEEVYFKEKNGTMKLEGRGVEINFLDRLNVEWIKEEDNI